MTCARVRFIFSPAPETNIALIGLAPPGIKATGITPFMIAPIGIGPAEPLDETRPALSWGSRRACDDTKPAWNKKAFLPRLRVWD